MPAALGPADLTNLQVSEEEIQAARLVLTQAGKQEKRAKMAAMSSWLLSNPDTTISSSRGDDRLKWLQHFLVHQSRSKAMRKTVQHTKAITEKRAKKVNHHLWAQEQMDKEMGAMKAAVWRDTLPWVVCPVTNKGEKEGEEYLRHYKVPVHWEAMTSEDINTFLFEASGEGSAKDLDLLVDAEIGNAGSSSGSSSSAVVPIKVEGMSPEKKAELDLEAAKKRLPEMIAEVNSLELRTRDILGKIASVKAMDAGRARYLVPLEEDLKKQTNVLVRFTSLLKKMMAAPPAALEDYKKVEASLEAASNTHTEFLPWCEKYDLTPKGKGQPSKKRRTASKVE